MIRLLFLGDLATTGFGTVTADLGKALLDLGVDVRFVSQNEVKDLPEPFASRTLALPDPDFITGKAAKDIAQIATGQAFEDGWQPEAILIVGDYTGVEMVVSRAPLAFTKVPTFHYVPIEGDGLPPSWATMWSLIEPIAMSRFGQAQIAKVIGREPLMAYHGVDTTVYHQARPDYPLRTADGQIMRSKADAKRRVRADPDRIMLLRTDRFMPRKRFASMFRAVVPVLEAHPDVDLVLHCRSIDQGGNLDHAISKLPTRVRGQIIVTDAGGGLSRDMLAALYNAADLFISTGSEGFGLNLAESIACGTPAMGMDYSSVPEVIGPAGVVVPIAGVVDNEYDHWWGAVDEAAYTVELEHLVSSRTRRLKLGALGPAHVKRNFTWAGAARIVLARAAERLGREVAA